MLYYFCYNLYILIAFIKGIVCGREKTIREQMNGAEMYERKMSQTHLDVGYI